MDKSPSRSPNPVAGALYVNAAILLAILLALLHRSAAPDLAQMAAAQSFIGQAQPSIAGGSGIYVMPAQFHPQLWGCYLLNTNTQTLCTYEYDAGVRTLTLTSARDFSADMTLKNFATTPAPWEIEQMVGQEKQDQQSRLSPPRHENPAHEAPPSPAPAPSPGGTAPLQGVTPAPGAAPPPSAGTSPALGTVPDFASPRPGEKPAGGGNP